MCKLVKLFVNSNVEVCQLDFNKLTHEEELQLLTMFEAMKFTTYSFNSSDKQTLQFNTLNLNIYKHQQNARLKSIDNSSKPHPITRISTSPNDDATIHFVHEHASILIAGVGRNIYCLTQILRAVNKTYLEFKNKSPLQYMYIKEKSGYKLQIDFSKHSFDILNRKELFKKIGAHYGVDTDSLFTKNESPSLLAMHSILKKIVDILLLVKPFPVDQAALFMIEPGISDTKEFYFENTYMPLIRYVMEEAYSLLPSDEQMYLNTLAQALENAKKQIPYQNKEGESCIAEPFCFNSLNQLLENNRKLQVIDSMKSKIFDLNTGGFTNIPVCIAQKKYLITLVEEIITSPKDMTLTQIRTSWENREIEFEKTSMTIAKLMSIRNKSNFKFIANSSPDLHMVCMNVSEKENTLSFS